jgi:hypothetical protein
VSFAIIRGSNSRRHEVDFGDTTIEVDVAIGSETVQITVEAIQVVGDELAAVHRGGAQGRARCPARHRRARGLNASNRVARRAAWLPRHSVEA